MRHDIPRHTVSVAAAVFDASGRVLAICREDNGHWEPPGGLLEVDEGIHEGLAREVLEETGLLVEPVALTGVYKNVARGIVALVFRCALVGGDLHRTGEARDARWLTEEEVRSLMDEAYAVRLLDAFQEGTPRVRSHDGFNLLEHQEGLSLKLR